MKVKFLKLLMIISSLTSLIFLPGCWDRTELNELSIVTGLGVDPGPTESEITVVYQIVNPSAASGTQGVSSTMTPFMTLHTSGKTIYAAIRKSSREVSRKLYFGHLQVILINSELAEKSGIKDLLDMMYRDPEIREDIPVAITKGQKVDHVLSNQSILESNNALSILKHLDNTYETESCSRPVELREIINTLTSPSAEVVLPYIALSPYISKSQLSETQDSSQASVIKAGGFAIFNNDKIVGYLEIKDARALNFITDHIEKTVIVVPYKANKQSIDLISSKTKRKASIKYGKPRIDLEIEIQANVGEANGPIDLTKVSTLADLEKATNRTVKKEVEDVLGKIQKEFKVDAFRFGEVIERQHPKDWKTLKDNWEKEFVDLEVHVNVNTKINDIGMKNKSFQLEMKKK